MFAAVFVEPQASAGRATLLPTLANRSRPSSSLQGRLARRLAGEPLAIELAMQPP